ncbi:MAG: AraC-like DNA-binding protein [Clostridium sp.]|jgi:AraC-like DNA-binding protein
MQRSFVTISQDGMEMLEYSSPSFPCIVLFADVAKFITGDVPWHWHTDIELIFIKNGTAKFNFRDTSYIIHQWEGGFINRNILHSLQLYECESCEIITFIFSPSLFTGGIENEFYHKFSTPLYSINGLDFISFTNKIAWTTDCLNSILCAYSAYISEDPGKELLIIEYLTHIWNHLLHDGISNFVQIENIHSSSESRVKIMMKFIHEHYSEQLTLQRISESARISTRECTRCFRNTIKTSPTTYLIKYRITTAASLLSISSYSITEVGAKTGFNNSSYFTRMFQRYMNVTPKQYKQLHTSQKNV